jgi:5-methylcytosine-specific restriction endonuclease McrA
MSKARYARMKEYGKLRKEYLAKNRLCQKCGKKATDVHHLRGRTGRLLCMEEHWAPVCRRCHDWIGANPIEARQEGLLCELGKWNTP